ncbi:MAG: zinc finger domain-containing protein [Acetobacteraceae bacterium]|nr:zinc finger domain-containing protein [Acetobacteraceae bacterium]
MPEGHVVHRLAAAFTDHFVGHVLAASSPQGRFAEGAAAVDGHRLLAAEAWGKQMFLGFEGDLWLRVHLGMYGMWRFSGPGLAGIGRRTGKEAEQDEDGRPLPRGAVRLRLASNTHIGDLSGPTFCGIETPAEKAAATAAIGPDPLRPGARPGRAWDIISASKMSIGQLLMRQNVIGGIGNIYRAELLFRARIEPHKPGRDLTRAQFDALWRDARALLRDGVRDGAIITTRPQDRPAGTPVVGRRMRRDARSYVAFRNGEPCRICGTPIAMELMAGRKLYWCPTCQIR